jgi:NADH:ubiquinone oxidoreductase subunit C
MEINALIEKISGNFNGDVHKMYTTSAKRLLVKIRKEALLEIANYFIDELNYRFIIATGMLTEKGFEILYHFSDDKDGNIINLCVELPPEEPEIDSLANLIDAANWIEREIHDLFGIVFLNHPGGGQFIADGNWAENEHPYAKRKTDELQSNK